MAVRGAHPRGLLAHSCGTQRMVCSCLHLWVVWWDGSCCLGHGGQALGVLHVPDKCSGVSAHRQGHSNKTWLRRRVQGGNSELLPLLSPFLSSVTHRVALPCACKKQLFCHRNEDPIRKILEGTDITGALEAAGHNGKTSREMPGDLNGKSESIH